MMTNVEFGANRTKRFIDDTVGLASTMRLHFRRGPGARRICKISHSPYASEGETMFTILSDGKGIGDCCE